MIPLGMRPMAGRTWPEIFQLLGPALGQTLQMVGIVFVIALVIGLPLAVIVHIAKWLRTAACQPQAELPPPDRTLLQFLRLSPAHLGRLSAEVHDRLISLSSLLSVPPDQSVAFPNAVRSIVDSGRQRPAGAGGAENAPAQRLSSA